MPRIGESVKRWTSAVNSWLCSQYSVSSGALDEERRFILEKEVELLYRGFVPGAVGTLLGSLLFTAAMWERAGTAMLSSWLAAVWIVTLMRGLLVRRFLRASPPADELPHWINAFIVGAAVAGGVWGLAAFLFISGSDDGATMLVVFFVAGVSAAGIALFAPVLRAMGAFLLAILVPLSLRLLQVGDSAYLFVSAAVLVYAVVLLSASRRNHTMIWDTMLTSLANERLKKAFIVEKALADEREKTVARLTALERDNALFRNVVERAANFAIVVQDTTARGRIIYANDAACQHFGTDRDTLLTWTPYDFDLHYDEAMSWKDPADYLLAGESFTFEAEHRAADGKLVPVEVIAHPFEQDGRILSVSYIKDIRERRKTEAQRLQYEAALARQEVEEHYRSLVEALPDFTVRLDTQARFVYLHPSALKHTGREESAFLGRTAIETGIMGNPAVEVRLYESALRAVKSGEAQVYRESVEVAGVKRHMDMRHIPEKDAAGNVVSVLGIARDITEQVKIDDALRFIAQRGWSSDGEPFIVALARYLGKALDSDYVIIDRLADDPSEAETVAISARGKVLPNMRYSLEGTPCENVMAGSTCCYPHDVQQHFPADKMLTDMGVESYIGMPLWDSANQVIGLITVMDSKPVTDEATVTGLLQLVATRVAAELERTRSEQALKAREEQYRRLLDDSPDAIVRYDDQCRRTYTNAVFNRNLVTSLGKTPLEDWGLPTGVEAAEAYQARVLDVLNSGVPDEWESAWNDADGNPVCYLIKGTPEFDRHGQVVGVLAVARDISERKRLEAATIVREQEFRALVENSPDYISRFDRECRRIYINPCSAALLGDEKSELGQTPSRTYPDYAPAKEYETRLRRALDSGKEDQFLFVLPLDDGRECFYDMRLVPERDENGHIASILSIGRDISDRMYLEEELRRQASYDALTSLPNRWSFGGRLREEMAKAERSGGNLALLFIDLDRFKEVNDMLGHEIGDQLLTEVARRIQSCVRESDIVARLGGDEFVVSMPVETDTVLVGSIAQKIIDAVTRPFTINEHLAYVSASIGIACYPCDADSADALLSCADQAMYAVKQRGRSGASFFTPSMQAQVESRVHLANDLREALSQQQLQVYYQPIVETATGQVVKAEALLRWRHPARGMVPPDLFIPVAEDTGIIHELGNWVFHEAVKLAMLWREQCSGECIQVSVNISPRQFMHGQSIESWLGYLAETGLPGRCIAIEITEGLLLDDQGGVKERLARLREAGIQVALDDFGTGYSAMAYLKKFNIDYLKIDRSFVRDLAIDESDRAIAETIIVMASRLGLKTIAEGVETVEQRDMLAAAGCEYVQGYLYAHPMPLEELLDYTTAAQTGLESWADDRYPRSATDG